jgi:hypothetical protein
MKVQFDFSNLHRTTASEYSIRFVLGGLVTLATGAIAHRYGPIAGGLFLAFPAIFPASATLVEKHETERKRSHGLQGVRRGRRSAALDAIGAALGSLGLVVFALVVWLAIGVFQTAAVLPAATIAWLVVALVAWRIRRALPVDWINRLKGWRD